MSAAIALIVLPSVVSAEGFSKSGSSEVRAFVFEGGGHQIGMSWTYVGNECLSTGSPGDAFTFTNDLVLDNTAGEQEISAEFSIHIYTSSLGVRGSELYSETVTLTAAATESVTGTIGGTALEYTGWNGDSSCGGNFEVYRAIDLPGTYIPTTDDSRIY